MPARDERGGALLLVPALFLVALTLASIAFDFAARFEAQRELVSAAQAAANDAATEGLDDEALTAGLGYRIDPRLAEAAARRSVAARCGAGRFEGPAAVVADVSNAGPPTVRVTVRARARRLFAPALGRRGFDDLQASADAVVVLR